VGDRAQGLARFEKTSEIVPLKKPTARLSTAVQVVRALEKRGFKKLLVEGGGAVMWDFVRENLIDEYHVTLTPWAIGGRDAPTLIDGEGFTAKNALKLRLKSCRRVGDELYLIYKK
jgi:2,5-diamino-6-(ribosylamino)-4(3H)-pyrimidinone 5'-phosphate reductase